MVDLDTVIDCYGSKLGLKSLCQPLPDLAFFDCDSLRLMVSNVSEGVPTGNSVLYFRVPDIDRAFESLASNGVGFIGKTSVIHSKGGYELRMMFLKSRLQLNGHNGRAGKPGPLVVI